MLSRKTAKKGTGAWQRFNRWLHKSASAAQKTNIATDEDLLGTVNDLFEGMALQAGFETVEAYTAALQAAGNAITNPAQLLSEWISNGIPYSAWSGKVVDPIYTKIAPDASLIDGDLVITNPSSDTPMFYPRGTGKLRMGAFDLRQRLLTMRKLQNNQIDFFNREISRSTNPGGSANDVKEPAGTSGNAGNPLQYNGA